MSKLQSHVTLQFLKAYGTVCILNISVEMSHPFIFMHLLLENISSDQV